MAPVPLPPRHHSVNPYIVVADAARLIDFLIGVFGGVKQGRQLRDDDAIEHADVLIGDSLVMLSGRARSTPHVRTCTSSLGRRRRSQSVVARLSWAHARSWHRPISGGGIAWAESWIRSTTAGGSRPTSASSVETRPGPTDVPLALHGQVRRARPRHRPTPTRTVLRDIRPEASGQLTCAQESQAEPSPGYPHQALAVPDSAWRSHL
jgi:uncharacterized glyoxalase superfamily protein PhnB